MSGTFWQNTALKDAVDSADTAAVLNLCKTPGSASACRRIICVPPAAFIAETVLDYAFVTAQPDVFRLLLSGYSAPELAAEKSAKAASALFTGGALGYKERELLVKALKENDRGKSAFFKGEAAWVLKSGNSKAAGVIMKLKLPQLYGKVKLLGEAAERKGLCK